MRRITVGLAALGLLGATALINPGWADAGQSASIGTSVDAKSAAFSCPTSGAICFYDSRNFNNLLEYWYPLSCGGTITLGYPNRAESVRNRTGCRVYLLYYCGNGNKCYDEWMRPYSEDGTIAPLNAIDLVGLTAG